jgi:hypothetical protein
MGKLNAAMEPGNLYKGCGSSIGEVADLCSVEVKNSCFLMW